MVYENIPELLIINILAYQLGLIFIRHNGIRLDVSRYLINLNQFVATVVFTLPN